MKNAGIAVGALAIFAFVGENVAFARALTDPNTQVEFSAFLKEYNSAFEKALKQNGYLHSNDGYLLGKRGAEYFEKAKYPEKFRTAWDALSIFMENGGFEKREPPEPPKEQSASELFGSLWSNLKRAIWGE